MDPQLVVERLTVEAKVALERGETERALPLAERALAVSEGVSYLYDRSSARLVLARALAQAKRDPARSQALAAEARRGFAELGDAPRVEEAAALVR